MSEKTTEPRSVRTSVDDVEPLIYPGDLGGALLEVLGWPNFRCGPIAHRFRAAGYEIPTRAEPEQAFVLHWLVRLVLRHGDKWKDAATDDLDAIDDELVRRGLIEPRASDKPPANDAKPT